MSRLAVAVVALVVAAECPGAVGVAFSDRTGAITSLSGSDGAERVRAAGEFFTVGFLDERGDETVLKSSDFTFTREKGRFVYCRAGGPRVEVAVRETADAIRLRPRVSEWPSGLRLNWIDIPDVRVSASGLLFWPYKDGCEVSDYTTRANNFLSFRNAGWLGRCTYDGAYYPGNVQMQYLAHYRDGHGLYFAAEDASHAQKLVDWEWIDAETVRLSLQTLCGDAANGVWEAAGEIVLRPYDGAWMEAAEFYRDWVRTLPGFDRSPQRPAWAEDSPVTLIYPVRGEGMDNTVGMRPNRYYPYVNALKEVEAYSKAFDSRVMALLMHWEGTAPWCPPYVWPPYGGEAALGEFRDELHRRGHLLGLYCSGTAWTQVSCVYPSYTREREFVEGGLWRYMMRGPKGEIDAFVCNHTRAQRFGYDLCLTEEWCRKTLIDEVLKIARFGVDYCQFFDQNLGGGPQRCWSAAHRHPSVPGAWATAAMVKLQDDMCAAIRSCGSEMTIGCEGAAATPFVKNLAFNDARSFFPRRFGRSVPAMAFVFHEWMCNFSGNQVAVRSDEHFRWAYSFHCGDMLSAVLGPEGKLVTAWAVSWSDPLPDQGQLVGLIAGLNRLRRAYPQYLLCGRMVRPSVRIECREVELPGSDVKVRYPEVLSSCWEAQDGSRLGFATNWRKEKVAFTMVAEDGSRTVRTLEPLETVTLRQ